MPKSALDIFNEKLQLMADGEAAMAEAVIAQEQALYKLILEEYLPRFETVDGLIVSSPANDVLISELDGYFNKIQKALHRDILAPFVQNVLETVNLSAEYYIALGFKDTIIKNILKDKISLETKLGVTPTGLLKKDGYLYQLGQTDQVRQKLKNYVIGNLTGDTPFLQFQLGFRNLVIGNKRVQGLATNGALQQYFDQYAIDSFAQLDAVANKQFANELQLEHFIYEGSIIKTTRPFCQKRAGKAFKVSETKNWKNDPDLIDKKNKESYRPLIDRGRYRCRHAIRYITKGLYKQLTGNA